ncbi:MAG: response regulator transcription factor [Pegethrix bostrychoides GSE-TBD4-15B]|jgi:DNA-binding NarL/FixJ family response regulator|uniref:Response regulator transcription factor n=1 Tax=Pegethrix bostrychoides GSE-TBD4-15B TaxID=2839662 RepID=A0A951U5K7_9CYAN|nr:response regulator transcription factor [Pegethrix bostrychoides GSE-TBD4-15B]
MPLTVLVAEDDLGTRLSVSDYLELQGYGVITAENGQKALETVSQYQPHLIVTDIAMPLLDGFEFIRQVRLQPAFRLLPVIFLTARNDSKARIRGYQVGCDAYLPKPFELAELGAVVRNLLERAQLIESEWRLRLRSVDPAPSLVADSSPDAESERQAAALGLTCREQDVLNVLIEGHSNGQIGDQLHISPRTVEKYVSSLLRKTETSNRAELVRYALEHHLVKEVRQT